MCFQVGPQSVPDFRLCPCCIAWVQNQSTGLDEESMQLQQERMNLYSCGRMQLLFSLIYSRCFMCTVLHNISKVLCLERLNPTKYPEIPQISRGKLQNTNPSIYFTARNSALPLRICRCFQ